MDQRQPRAAPTRLVRILAGVMILSAIASLTATFVLEDKTLRIAAALFNALCASAFAWAVWPRQPASR